MKDIDFDELDRAVSSVLEPVASKTPASEPATAPVEPTADPAVVLEKETPESPAQTVEAAPVAVAEPAPSVESEAPVVAPAPPVAKTPLAIKRRGQFMDVVHPSSDMTNKPEDTTAASAARKVNLKPLNASVVSIPDPESTTPDVDKVPTAEVVTPTEAMTEPQPPTETVEPTPADRAMPDPLDVMKTQEEAKDASLVEASAVEDTPVDATGEPDAGTNSDDEATPTTPFLTDTKVDKRPLDAFSGEEAPADAVVDPTVSPEEPLPPELQADVIAVESNPSERADGEGESSADDEKKEGADAGFNASIPQQYTATDAKADDDHSIFDTSEYHQPIAPTKTKKGGLPGWIVAVLVIFLLAGLGAAGGYFWFYYGL